MNPPSTKCLVRDIRCHSVNKIRWCVQYVIALGFCVLSRQRSICTRIAILEKRLKNVHSTYWKCFFIIKCDVGLKVKIAKTNSAPSVTPILKFCHWNSERSVLSANHSMANSLWFCLKVFWTFRFDRSSYRIPFIKNTIVGINEVCGLHTHSRQIFSDNQLPCHK